MSERERHLLISMHIYWFLYKVIYLYFGSVCLTADLFFMWTYDRICIKMCTHVPSMVFELTSLIWLLTKMSTPSFHSPYNPCHLWNYGTVLQQPSYIPFLISFFLFRIQMKAPFAESPLAWQLAAQAAPPPPAGLLKQSEPVPLTPGTSMWTKNSCCCASLVT